MKVTFLILTILVLSPTTGHALGFDDCEEQPFQPETGCDGPEGPDDDIRDHFSDPPPLPTTPPDPTTPETPPSTLPPSQITTFAQGMGQLTLLTDFYLKRTLEGMSGTSVSMGDVLAFLSQYSAAEDTPQGAAILPANVKLFVLKLRILEANNPSFIDRTTYPIQFRDLLDRTIALDLEERGLEARS